MGKAFPLLLIICFIFTDPLCHAQTTVKVSDPRLEMVGNTIHIYYDILENDPEEKYDVSIVIKDEDGKQISARTLNGDIGIVEQGGSNKQITWNIEADNIYLDAFVFVQVNARVIPPPKPVIPEPVEETKQELSKEEELVDNTPSENDIQQEDKVIDERAETTKPVVSMTTEPPSTSASKHYSRTGIILQSLAVPGLGLSRVKSKPHWLRAVAGYGCIAGSVILDQQATKTYNGIEDLEYFDEVTRAYDKAILQENTSYILLYAAAGIWVTDLLWNIISTSDLSGKSLYSHSSGFSLGSGVDPFSRVPLMSIRYRF